MNPEVTRSPSFLSPTPFDPQLVLPLLFRGELTLVKIVYAEVTHAPGQTALVVGVGPDDRDYRNEHRAILGGGLRAIGISEGLNDTRVVARGGAFINYNNGTHNIIGSSGGLSATIPELLRKPILSFILASDPVASERLASEPQNPLTPLAGYSLPKGSWDSP